MHNNFLMGVKFGTSWRNFREFSKSPSWREFLKNILKSVILEKIVKGFFWKIEAVGKMLKGIFVDSEVRGDFPVKNEENFFSKIFMGGCE